MVSLRSVLIKMERIPFGLFLVVVLVIVIEKIELVKPDAKRIEDEDENEDENEDDDDIPAR